MIIEQSKMDDAVMQVRVRSLLKFIGGLLQDRMNKELPPDLQRVKEFIRQEIRNDLFPGISRDDSGTRFHTFHLLEVLSEYETTSWTMQEALGDTYDGGSSGLHFTSETLVPAPVMAELLIDQGSDPEFLNCGEEESDE